MNTPAAQPPAAGPASIQASINDTERLLKDCATRTRRGNMLTVIVGAFVLLLLGGYFAYGYSQIADVTKPKVMVDAAESWLEDQIPEVRKTLEAEVDKSAPVWAESLSKQAQASLPTVREKLEAYVLDQADQIMEQTVNLTEEHFRKVLKEKREVLEEGFNDLAKSPKLAKETLRDLVDAMEGVFQADMKEGSSEMFARLNFMTEKLTRLKAGKDLNPEENLERLVLMQVRRLQSDHILANSASEEAAAAAAEAKAAEEDAAKP